MSIIPYRINLHSPFLDDIFWISFINYFAWETCGYFGQKPALSQDIIVFFRIFYRIFYFDLICINQNVPYLYITRNGGSDSLYVFSQPQKRAILLAYSSGYQSTNLNVGAKQTRSFLFMGALY